MPSHRRPRRRQLAAPEIESLQHIPVSLLRRVRLVRTNFLPPAADGMTIGRFIFLRGDKILDGPNTLLAHELVHVRQFFEQGPVRFIYRYLSDYLTNLIRLKNHHQAYLQIPFEIEAREEAAGWEELTRLREEERPKRNA